MCKCTENGCDKRASYNLICVKPPLYCSMHKKEDMVNVVTKRCIIKECNTRPCYNLPGNTNGIYCLKHKKEDMINVITKRCKYEGCTTRPYYNLPGNTNGIYCLKHKKEDMINVIDKRCLFEGCTTIPYYNLPGNTNGIYCLKHKKEDMINVITKNCLFEGCTTRPCYNLPGNTNGIYCLKHKKEDMINVIDKRCLFEGCTTIPCYNLPGNTNGIYCLKHKKEDMINVIDKRCKTPLCDIISNDKYRGYCFSCFVHTFPDEPNSRNYKTKEKYTTDYIKEKISNVDWVVDRKVYDGCSRRRPDLYLDLGYQVLVVEIDENQHTNYDCSCENKRLMEISQDIGHRPLIFIRFNPDDYVSGENKITSCWVLDGNGICTVKKSKKKEWEERLTILEYQIRYWLDPENKTDKTVEVVQLYYDQ